MVDLQKVFIRVMCFTGRVADGHRRLAGLLTAVIGKWEAFKLGSCPALDIRVI